MPPLALGATTKHFRAYGKRRTNVINRRQPLGGWDASPVAATVEVNSSSDSDSTASSSSESDSSSSEDDVPSPIVKRAPAKVTRVKQAPFKIVLAPPRSSTTSTSTLTKGKRSSTTAAGKENPQVHVQTAVAKGKGKAKAVPQEADNPSEEEDNDNDDEASPLRPARVRARPALVKKVVYGGRRSTKAAVPSSSSSWSSDSVSDSEGEQVATRALGSARRAVRSSVSSGAAVRRAQVPRRAPVVVSDDGTDEDEEEVVEDRPSRAIADEEASSSSAPSSSDDDAAAAADPRPAPASAGRFPPQLRPLQPLLLSPTLFSFSSFVTSPPRPFAPSPSSSSPWRKIGEASYSEVFATTDAHGRDMVVKVIPVASPHLTRQGRPAPAVPLPFVSSWDAVKREVEVSALLGGGGDEGGGIEGFVRFRGAFLVQGAYPQELLAAWDAFKGAQRPPCDEQVRPDVLPPTQLYALLLLSNAGTALETHPLGSWVEACAVLAQVVEALGRAEDACRFEHRDLHWGNILLEAVPTRQATTSAASSSSLSRRLGSLSLSHPRALSPLALLDPATSGIRATLIDFTLSRCDAGPPARVLFDALEDEELFEGEGEYQFEVYRMMRALVGRRGEDGEGQEEGWRVSEPRTNVLWLHYLTTKLLHSSRLRAPPPPFPSPPCPAPASPSSASSPRRAPLPRRPLTRRRSAAFPAASSPLLASPLKARARTLPAQVKAQVQSARERAAHEALRRAEGTLRRVVEGWGLRTGPGSGSGARARGVGRTRRGGKAREEEEGEAAGERGEGDFAGAGEFGRWWFGEIARV